MKLLIEQAEGFQDLVYESKEDTSGKKHLYIKGPYMAANIKNGNKRLYPLEVLVEAVNDFSNTKIKNKTSIGELNHPPSPSVDLERACHLITEIVQDDNIFYGKSRVLSSPLGKIVESLINDGVTLGMSSRALGAVDQKTDYNLVTGMKLATVDVVHEPSYQSAFVDSILENKEWIINDNGDIEPLYDEFENKINTIPNLKKEEHLLEAYLSFINQLKG